MPAGTCSGLRLGTPKHAAARSNRCGARRAAVRAALRPGPGQVERGPREQSAESAENHRAAPRVARHHQGGEPAPAKWLSSRWSWSATKATPARTSGGLLTPGCSGKPGRPPCTGFACCCVRGTHLVATARIVLIAAGHRLLSPTPLGRQNAYRVTLTKQVQVPTWRPRSTPPPPL